MGAPIKTPELSEISGLDWLHPFIAWHEFGHELVYRTSNDFGYQVQYLQGPFAILEIIPTFALYAITGDGNEARVATFLYKYTHEVVAPYNPVSVNEVFNSKVTNQAAYGQVRGSLWYIGHYSFAFSQAWDLRIKNTRPTANAAIAEATRVSTQNIATATFFSNLTGLNP